MPEYNNEELLQSLRRLADDLGRSPSTTDLANADGMASRSTYRDRFGSWNKALAAADLEPAQELAYSRGEVLDAIEQVAERLDKTPTRAEFLDESSISEGPVRRHFGSWSDALGAAGLSPDRSISKRQLIEGLREFANYYGRARTGAVRKRDMDENGAHAASTYTRQFGSWTQAIVQAGLDPDTRRLEKGDLLDAIDDLAERFGRRPTYAEMIKYGEYSGAPFEREFGSWSNALVEAGFEPPAGGRPSGSFELSDGDLVDEMQRVARKWGRTPTESEFDDHSDYSSTTYVERFGSWLTAVERAGLDPLRMTTSASVERPIGDGPSGESLSFSIKRHEQWPDVVDEGIVEYEISPGDGIGDLRSDMVYEILTIEGETIETWPVGYRGNLRRMFTIGSLVEGIHDGRLDIFVDS